MILMLRKLLILMSVTSGVMSVGAVVLWRRSYFVADFGFRIMGDLKAFRHVEIKSGSGRLFVGTSRVRSQIVIDSGDLEVDYGRWSWNTMSPAILRAHLDSFKFGYTTETIPANGYRAHSVTL